MSKKDMEFDISKITDNAMILIFIFIIGLVVGAVSTYHLSVKTTDEQISYAENIINMTGWNKTQLRREGGMFYYAIYPDMKMSDVYAMYYGGYHNMARNMLAAEISKMCGARPIGIKEVNVSLYGGTE